MPKAITVGVDVPPVRERDAVLLMVHHLGLAFSYFEATPDTQVQALTELHDAFDDHRLALARQWYLGLDAAYKAMDH